MQCTPSSLGPDCDALHSSACEFTRRPTILSRATVLKTCASNKKAFIKPWCLRPLRSWFYGDETVPCWNCGTALLSTHAQARTCLQPLYTLTHILCAKRGCLFCFFLSLLLLTRQKKPMRNARPVSSRGYSFMEDDNNESGISKVHDLIVIS
jgi:hypothetical protein